MYDIPSNHDVIEVVISEETIIDGKQPRIVTKSSKKKSA
jgi:ATP-dependent protease Clp ATPase subunit